MGDSGAVSFPDTPSAHKYTQNGTARKRGANEKINYKVEEVKKIRPRSVYRLFTSLFIRKTKRKNNCPPHPSLSLNQKNISALGSSFFHLVSPITVAHNGSLCLPGSNQWTLQNGSHSSLSLSKHFRARKKKILHRSFLARSLSELFRETPSQSYVFNLWNNGSGFVSMHYKKNIIIKELLHLWWLDL